MKKTMALAIISITIALLPLSALAQESNVTKQNESIRKYYDTVKHSYVIKFNNITTKKLLDTLLIWNGYTIKYNLAGGLNDRSSGIIRKQDFRSLLMAEVKENILRYTIHGNSITIKECTNYKTKN